MFYFESFSTQCFLVYDTHIHMLAHIYLSCGCVMHWFDSQKFLCNALTGAVQYQSYQHSHPEQKGICNVSSAKSFPFSINCSCKLVVSSHTGSATVFLLKLICENACFLSGHMTLHTLIMHCFTNSPSVKGRVDLTISSATTDLLALCEHGPLWH